MDQLEFYTDDAGLPCARGNDDRLATYLQTDIQGSPDIARQLSDVLNDPDYRGEITGNGHTLTITGKSVTIDSLFDDEAPSRRVSREYMLKVIKKWLTFIK